MKSFSYKNKIFKPNSNETVLDCLLRHEIEVQYACRNGVCHMCLMKGSNGTIPKEAQKGLSTIYKQHNLFLSCQCHPQSHMEIMDIKDEDLGVPATLISKEIIGHDVMRILLQPHETFKCKPGQYISLVNADGIKRNYSVANDPSQADIIELHIQLIQNGTMSNWLNDEAKIGYDVMVCGPFGECFYHIDNEQNYPIILVGTGVGLAPLYGISNDALEQKHNGKIELYHSVRTPKKLYLEKELRALEKKHKNFIYHPCVLNAENKDGLLTEDIRDIVSSEIQGIADIRLYICGAPKIVDFLRLKAIELNVDEECIYIDPFLPSVSP